MTARSDTFKLPHNPLVAGSNPAGPTRSEYVLTLWTCRKTRQAPQSGYGVSEMCTPFNPATFVTVWLSTSVEGLLDYGRLSHLHSTVSHFRWIALGSPLQYHWMPLRRRMKPVPLAERHFSGLWIGDVRGEIVEYEGYTLALPSKNESMSAEEHTEVTYSRLNLCTCPFLVHNDADLSN